MHRSLCSRPDSTRKLEKRLLCATYPPAYNAVRHGERPSQPNKDRLSTAMTDRLPMEINVRESGGVSVLEVHGRLTIGEPADQLHDALQAAIQGGAKKVVVILNGIPQIDSSGISTLVRISIKLAREGGVLRLVCGQGRVRDALTVTRLVEAIPTFESESAALQNFA